MSAMDQAFFDGPEPEDFEEPVPLFRETPPGEPYPLDALGPLTEVARAIIDHTQVPEALAGQAVLGVAAFAAQGIADVELLQGTAPTSLFLITVAQSGERKTAADKLAMVPVRTFQSELLDQYRGALQAFKNELEVYERKRKALLGRNGAVLDDLKEALDALGPEPPQPPLPIVVMSEPTVEGVFEHLHNSRPTLALLSDEGGMFVGGVGMNPDNRLRSVSAFSLLWNGTEFVRVRAGDGVTFIRGRRVTMHLLMQEVAARALFSDEIANNQGFNSRLLITKPVSTIGSRLQITGSAASSGVLKRYSDRILDMLRRPLPLRQNTTNELEPRTLRLTDEAKGHLRSFYVDVELGQAAGGPLEGCRAFASKAAEHAARLAAVIAVYEDPDTEEVSARDIGRGIALARFYLTEAVRLTDAAQSSVDTIRAEQIRIWLLEKWAELHISPADATQRGPCKDTTQNRKSIEILEAHGWLVRIEDGATIKGKRRRDAWRIVRPKVVALRDAAGTRADAKAPKLPTPPKQTGRGARSRRRGRT